MPQQKRVYPAKLLLFGEYTVLNGSQALAVPLNMWRGEWIKEAHSNRSPQGDIINYVTWMQKNELIDHDIERSILSDLDEGWNYQSTISIGYGIGSSGALVAAMYDRFFPASGNMEKMHAIMSGMEAYFHGASSGMDPLVSFTQKAVYKDESGRFHSVDDPGWPEGYKIYLFDSGLARETGPLVARYKERLNDKVYREKVEKQFVPMMEHALHFYLAGENKSLEECISVISQFQREYFDDMILDHVKIQWDSLTSLPGVYVKLCGAGGGGYYLVITNGEIHDFSKSLLIALN